MLHLGKGARGIVDTCVSRARYTPGGVLKRAGINKSETANPGVTSICVMRLHAC